MRPGGPGSRGPGGPGQSRNISIALAGASNLDPLVSQAEWDSYVFRCAREACGWRFPKWRSLCPSCGIFGTIVAIQPTELSIDGIDGPCATTIRDVSQASHERQAQGTSTSTPIDTPTARSIDHLKAFQFHKKSPAIEAKAKTSTREDASQTSSEKNIAIASHEPSERLPPRSKRARDLQIVDRVRVSTGFTWLDHFFGGGGPIEGHLVMVAAQPGTGKSSLLTEVIAAMSSIHRENALYAAGEESEDEVTLRAREGSKEIEGGVFGRWPGSIDYFCVHESTSPEDVVDEIDRRDARYVVVDSAGSSDSDQTSAGDGAQVTHAAKVYFQRAQATGIHKGKRKCVIFLVMHCTKDGDLAGPNKAVHEASFGVMMEHVDPVTLFVSEEPTSTVRLRVYKKSRGSSNKRRCYFDWDENVGRLVERPLDAGGNPLGSLVVQKKSPEKSEKPAYSQPSVPDLNLPSQPSPDTVAPSAPGPDADAVAFGAARPTPREVTETPLDSSGTTG